MTVSADSPSTSAPSDAELIAAVRAGNPDAYAGLYERHHAAAVGLARRYARNASDAEDLAAEGFANVLAALHGGSGPEEFFRAYLFTCISRLAARGNLTAQRENPSDDMARYEGEQPYDDPVLAGFETDAVGRAFRTLPERWQAVLWYTEVDDLQPSEVAPMLGLSPNAVSALAVRAREGLRQAYLQAHVASEAVSKECQAYADKLGAYTRNSLSQRKTQAVREHLDQCPHCSAALLQLEDVGFALRVVVFPLVTALPFTAPAAGELVAAGAAGGGTAGADWLSRSLSKVDRRSAVVGGALLAVALAGGVAFASLGQGTTTLPSAEAAPPKASDAGGSAFGSAASGAAASGAASSSGAASPSSSSVPESAQAKDQPGPSTAPGSVTPSAAGLPAPLAPSAALPGTTTAPAGAAPSGPAPSAASSPSGGASSGSASPSSIGVLYTLTASKTGVDAVDFKATPANAPALGTEIVVTVSYQSTLLAPSVTSGWSCNAPLVALGTASMTCAAPFTGGAQIPELGLRWTVAPASVSGTAVLRQGSSAVSNAAGF